MTRLASRASVCSGAELVSVGVCQRAVTDDRSVSPRDFASAPLHPNPAPRARERGHLSAIEAGGIRGPDSVIEIFADRTASKTLGDR